MRRLRRRAQRRDHVARLNEKDPPGVEPELRKPASVGRTDLSRHQIVADPRNRLATV
jgi:hypothetical protein